MAAEEIADLVAVDAKLKAIKKELRAAVQARGSHLMDLFGVGPAGAARILSDVGDVARFPDRNHFASWTGTAPLDASSGEQIRHRLSRAGNRRLNHVLHIAAIVQIRHDTEGRAYYRRKLAESKTPMEALRCLKRRLSDAVYRQLVADADTPAQTSAAESGPGRALGGVFTIQRGRPVHPGHRLFGSATSRTRTTDATADPAPLRTPARPRLPSPPRRRAGAVKVERPTGRTTLTATSAGAHSGAETAPLTQRGTRSGRSSPVQLWGRPALRPGGVVFACLVRQRFGLGLQAAFQSRDAPSSGRRAIVFRAQMPARLFGTTRPVKSCDWLRSIYAPVARLIPGEGNPMIPGGSGELPGEPVRADQAQRRPGARTSVRHSTRRPRRAPPAPTTTTPSAPGPTSRSRSRDRRVPRRAAPGPAMLHVVERLAQQALLLSMSRWS